MGKNRRAVNISSGAKKRARKVDIGLIALFQCVVMTASNIFNGGRARQNGSQCNRKCLLIC